MLSLSILPLLGYSLTYILLFCIFIFVQVKASAGWRILTVCFALIICCWTSAKFAKYVAYQEIQGNYGKGVYFVFGSIEKLASDGKTNDIVSVCRKFQNKFLFLPQKEENQIFWDFVAETEGLANLTNQPNSTRQP